MSDFEYSQSTNIICFKNHCYSLTFFHNLFMLICHIWKFYMARKACNNFGAYVFLPIYNVFDMELSSHIQTNSIQFKFCLLSFHLPGVYAFRKKTYCLFVSPLDNVAITFSRHLDLFILLSLGVYVLQYRHRFTKGIIRK